MTSPPPYAATLLLTRALATLLLMHAIVCLRWMLGIHKPPPLFLIVEHETKLEVRGANCSMIHRQRRFDLTLLAQCMHTPIHLWPSCADCSLPTTSASISRAIFSSALMTSASSKLKVHHLVGSLHKHPCPGHHGVIPLQSHLTPLQYANPWIGWQCHKVLRATMQDLECLSGGSLLCYPQTYYERWPEGIPTVAWQQTLLHVERGNLMVVIGFFVNPQRALRDCIWVCLPQRHYAYNARPLPRQCVLASSLIAWATPHWPRCVNFCLLPHYSYR